MSLIEGRGHQMFPVLSAQRIATSGGLPAALRASSDRMNRSSTLAITTCRWDDTGRRDRRRTP